MNEHPEWLVERLAETISHAHLPTVAWEDWSESSREHFADQATAVLDRLGFAPYCGPTYWRSNIQWEGAE